MISDLPTPLHIIQDSRYAKQDGWELGDISLCSSGNFAVSGHNYWIDQSYVSVYGSTVDNSDSRDKPTLLYHKQFTDELSWRRCVSFIKPNSTEIVTCRYDEVQVIDYKRDVVLRSRKVNGRTTCLSVSESQIFIGLRWSDIIIIFDNDLNKIKSIRLKGIRRDDWPWDMAAAADRLCVCTWYGGRAIVYSQDSGTILTKYTTGQDRRKKAHCRSSPYSIAVNIELGLTAVLWRQDYASQKQIFFYVLSKNKSFLNVNVESGVSRIRISSHQGRTVTGNEDTGEVKIYTLASLLSYSCLKENLVSGLGRDDCEKLTDFFAMGREECNTILSSDRPTATLLLALEEKGVIQPSNADRLKEAFLGLKMSSFYHAVNIYQKLRDQITSYDRFLATLSAHLTSSVPADLCDYFHVSGERKASIITSQNPGLSLLLALDEMGIIKSSEVGCLEEPFNKFNLVQAVAKIHEYKEILEEENRQLLQTAPYSLEDKRALFVEFLKKKIKSWYETMTPVPWKKSCQWKSTDLFVGSGLILTDSKAKQNIQNIDEQCKLNYTEIFTHDKLKSKIRIILEGDPGAGKTMLSSQLAYDWSKGKIDGVDILVFLPLKIVEDKTLIQAIEQFYIPTNSSLLENDIESILASDTERICLLLDGLEEYSTGGRIKAKESPEVMKIMKKEKHSNCKVVVTSRSDFANDLPECPLLKLGRFGETERNSYIEKLLPEDTNKQQKIKRIIQENPFILDLCSVPLLFVLAVHNIESISLSEEGQLSKVSPFMRSMILTLCSSSTVKHEVDGIRSKFFKSEKMTLGEIAFNGLRKGRQQLSWQKNFMESNVGSLKPWVDSGILVLEEDLVISEKEDQDISEINKGVIKKVATEKKNKKKGTQKQEGKGKGKKEKSPEGDSSEKPKKKKERKEEEADESEIVSDKMLMEEFLGPSTSHDISQLPILSEDVDMLTASMVVSKAGHEVSEKEEQHQSVSELKSDPHVMKKKTVRRAAGQVPLVVKFLHKVIQEWFAATFFCSMMRRCTSEEQFQNYVSSQLQHISPTDLHYVLRFLSYLHPRSCHVIITCLLRNYRKNGCVPQYIMNCVFLCFNEHNDDKGPDMRNAVMYVCKEVITIQSEDSRLLQQAKCALLAYASNEGVIIEKLELKDVIFAVEKTSLILNSGVQLGILHTVKVIKVSRWDQVLQEEDCKNILKLLSAGTLLKEVCCIFPSPPPDTLDEITLGNIVSKDLKVEWHIGHFVQSLDPKKGKWMMDFKKPGTSSTEIKEGSADQAKTEGEMQGPTTSSLHGTSTESSKFVHTQGTLKRIGSDSVSEFVVPEKKTKVVPEKPAVSDITQRVLQTGTVSSGEHVDILEEVPVRSVVERNVQEEAVASGVEQRTIPEEVPVTGVVQWFDQGQTPTVDIDERFNQQQMLMGGVRQRVSQEVASMNSITPVFFPRETFSDVTQRSFYGNASVRRAVQENSPILGIAQNQVEDNQVQLFQSQAVITQFGGVVEIPDTGVILRVPPNALPEDMEECLIQMRIIPTSMSCDDTMSFSSNSSVRVELLPNHFRFQCHVQLTLPHCLELKKNVLRRARIFMSHHNEGDIPQWEEQIEQFYQLLDMTIIIQLKRFCWIKCEIDDEIVEAKRLKIYTAARKMYLEDKYAVVEVGYHLDMPGEQEILKMNPNLILADRKPFVFLREGKQSLFIYFTRIVPQQWKYYDQNPKEIPFQSIAASLEQTCQFMVAKETLDRDIPMCFFTASQRYRSVDRTVDLMIRPEVHPFATPWDVR
ncbi:Protein NLRC5 [Holothuria leucospilota]|uniref:Protein NLRC5 n=1 Tax=Holothuria leucospilota TaxID=206669 RepID=A0A9Q1BBS5_HOLLE|nr:Protein NLRC5 [Holothuria leucospilota]